MKLHINDFPYRMSDKPHKEKKKENIEKKRRAKEKRKERKKNVEDDEPVRPNEPNKMEQNSPSYSCPKIWGNHKKWESI